MQPTDGKALPDGRVSLTLRCPDCSSWMTGTFAAERVRELDRQFLDSSRIRDELGWAPRWELDDGLRETWTWYEQHLGRD